MRIHSVDVLGKVAKSRSNHGAHENAAYSSSLLKPPEDSKDTKIIPASRMGEPRILEKCSNSMCDSLATNTRPMSTNDGSDCLGVLHQRSHCQLFQRFSFHFPFSLRSSCNTTQTLTWRQSSTVHDGITSESKKVRPQESSWVVSIKCPGMAEYEGIELVLYPSPRPENIQSSSS